MHIQYGRIGWGTPHVCRRCAQGWCLYSLYSNLHWIRLCWRAYMYKKSFINRDRNALRRMCFTTVAAICDRLTLYGSRGIPTITTKQCESEMRVFGAFYFFRIRLTYHYQRDSNISLCHTERTRWVLVNPTSHSIANQSFYNPVHVYRTSHNGVLNVIV